MNVTELLRQKDVGFKFIPHCNTYDAQRLAQSVHVTGRCVAKTVLLRVGTRFVVAVLPATTRVDLAKASELLDVDRVELATEAEIARHCPDCEVGALPPFGSYYGMRTIVDESLQKGEHIVFEGNTHHEAFRLRFVHFLRLERPRVGRFAEASQ